MCEFKVWRKADWEWVGITSEYQTARDLYLSGKYHVSGFNYPLYPGKE